MTLSRLRQSCVKGSHGLWRRLLGNWTWGHASGVKKKKGPISMLRRRHNDCMIDWLVISHRRVSSLLYHKRGILHRSHEICKKNFFFDESKEHTSQSALTSICSCTAFIRSRWKWGECSAKGTVSKLGTMEALYIKGLLRRLNPSIIPPLTHNSLLHKARFEFTMIPQPPLSLPPQRHLNPSVIKQQPHNTTLWYEGFYDGSNQQAPPAQQYQPPSSRRSRNQRKKWSRKTEHPLPNQVKHESSGAVFYNRSTGVDPGDAQIDASNNPGTGKVWRTPSKNPLMADCNLT